MMLNKEQDAGGPGYCMRVVLTIGVAGLALLQPGRWGANVQNKCVGQLLSGPGRSSTTLPASRQAASPSRFCVLCSVMGGFVLYVNILPSFNRGHRNMLNQST